MEWIPVAGVEKLSQVNRTWQLRQCVMQDVITQNRSDRSSSVLFLQAKKNKSVTSADVERRSALSSRFEIPKWLWRAKEQDYNGYFYGASVPSTPSNVSAKHVSIFRFMIKYVSGTTPRSGAIPDISYDWHVLTFVVHWEKDVGSTLLCFNVPSSLRDGIKRSVTTVEDLHSNPFAFHPLVVEQVVELYDQAIWQFRDFVRGAERHRPNLLQRPEPDYIAMHELARHTMHCSEVLTTTLSVMDHMISEFGRFSSIHSDLDHPDSQDPGPALRHQKSMLQFMLNRSVALENRLRNEIDLAFHITAQHTNTLSTEIAHATKVDGSATKTISILGLFFLPGTFVSAVFSMSFFNFSYNGTEDQHWNVSQEIWLYWIIAIPLTAITVSMWWWWPATAGAGSATTHFRRAQKGGSDV